MQGFQGCRYVDIVFTFISFSLTIAQMNSHTDACLSAYVYLCIHRLHMYYAYFSGYLAALMYI